MADWHPTTRQIERLFAARGNSQYGGEAVSQAEHALQAATLARDAGADEATIVAALLHDVGHLLHTLANDAPEHGIDDRHEELAARWLAGRFPPAVVEPVQLHVAAKRYLCAVEPAYHAELSPPSQLSLQLQGGPMNASEVAAFERLNWFPCAVVLRRCDDAAKIPGASTPSLADWLPLIDRQARLGGSTEAAG